MTGGHGGPPLHRFPWAATGGRPYTILGPPHLASGFEPQTLHPSPVPAAIGGSLSGRCSDEYDQPNSAVPVSAPGLRSFAWTESTHQVGGPTQAGADCARWCHDVFRLRGPLAAAIARTGAALRQDAPVFLPYLAGERAPVWSSDVRGAFHRVDRAHTADDFLWSVMEGVAHAVRDILHVAQSAAGIEAHELRAGGGGAQSDAWCSLKADVLGIPVIRSRAAETGLVGAAMAAAVGLGWYPDLRSAATRMARPGRRFAPRARFGKAYERRAALYDDAKRDALELAQHT